MNNLRYITKKYGLNQKSDRLELPGGRGGGGLASLWAELGFKTGAEIGVESGRYSATICKTNPDVKLYCIDAWEAYDGYREHVSSEQMEVLYQDTVRRVEPYNCEVIRAFSLDAAKKFKDKSLDFVYIDSNHDFGHVSEDIEHWIRKIRPGGTICGHDYNSSKVGATNEVMDAVDSYVAIHKIKPFFIWEGDSARSWMWLV